MAHSVILKHRFTAPVETLATVRANMSQPHRASWLRGGKQKLLVGTWLGVPGKHGDVAIPADAQPFGSCPLVVDISQKEGCYDGAIRWRLTLRWWTEPKPELLPPMGKMVIEEHGSDELSIICTWKGGGFWNLSVPRLNYNVCSETDPAGIVVRQAKQYYKHLEFEDIRSIADSFATEVPDWKSLDINTLNRFASRILYAQSRALGWRKLTMRDKVRHGIPLDHPQWIRADSPLLNTSSDGNPCGCGQYTIDAAHGKPIRTSYGLVETE